MAWFNNLRFRWKLSLPIGLLALVLCAVTIVGMQQINALSRVALEMGERHIPSLDYLLEADRDLQQALVAERTMIFLAVASDDYQVALATHRENIEQAEGRMRKYFELVLDDAARARADDFFGRFETWRATTAEIVRQRTEEGRQGRRVAIDMALREGSEHFEDMRSMIDELTGELMAQATAVAVEARDTSDNSQTALGSALIIGLLLALGVAILFPPLVTRPLQSVTRTMHDLASGDGDLTIRSDVRSRDELGQLAGGMNAFLDKLQTLIASLAQTADQVRVAAVQLSGLNAENQRMVDTQQQATERVARAMHEMSSTVGNVSESASGAAAAAQDADEQVVNGSGLVQESSAAIRGVAEDFGRATETVNALENQITGIGSVVDVIRGIAEQTNLLALNAAIEAARAGEQGRGFAVVADEVRTLAGRTQSSTAEIQGMIEQLQAGAGQAVSVMRNGQDRAQDTVGRAEAAGEALEAITQSVKAITDKNTQIASAAEEQHAVTSEVNQSVEEISGISARTAQASAEAAQASQILSGYAEDLDRVVKNFKI